MVTRLLHLFAKEKPYGLSHLSIVMRQRQENSEKKKRGEFKSPLKTIYIYIYNSTMAWPF